MKSLETYGKQLKELNAFVCQLDESIRLEAFKFLLSHEYEDGPPTKSSPGGVRHDRGLSPQELIRTCKASSLMDKALVLAFWIEEHQQKEYFSSVDLRDGFVSAREPAPSNPSDVVAKLDAAGKVMKSEKIGKVQYYRLTSTGVEQVQNWLNARQEQGGQK